MRVLGSALRFGPFRLDPVSATLWRDDRAVPLTPKAFAVLELLARHAGRLLTKDELLDEAWKDVFVGDAALKVCIREIRRALGDDPKAPTFIETHHRRGYRFIAQVTDLAPAAGVTAAPPPAGLAGPADGALTRPPIHYAQSGDVNIAYQVIGEGPLDLVFVMGWVSHLDYFWAEPSFARFLRRLASFARVILFDKRGTGLSDRVPLSDLPTLEQRMDDVRAVLDAAGSKRAALLGISEGGPMCALFAATYPEKTSALVMFGTYAKRVRSEDYPWGPSAEERERFHERLVSDWGGPVGIEERAPSLAHDPQFRDWWATYLRMGASPGAVLALTRMNAEIDIRHVLPTIRVPTLVLHRTDDRCLLVEEGRYVAAHVPGARFVELPGEDHLPFVGDQDALLREIEAFLTGPGPRHEDDRVLATVLSARFEDLTASSGDRLERTDRYRAHARREVEWFRGRHAESVPGGCRATFDGPARAIRCALVLAAAGGELGMGVRVGLHTGECVLVDDRPTGLAVEIADEVARRAPAGAVFVSRTVCDLVAGSGLAFDRRGSFRMGGAAGEWELLEARRIANDE